MPIPFPKNGNRLTYLVKDWQVSGTTTFRDGFASPVLSADGGSGTDSFHERPDCVGPIHYQLSDFSMPYVEAGAFRAEAPGTFGNCPQESDRRAGSERTGTSPFSEIQVRRTVLRSNSGHRSSTHSTIPTLPNHRLI